MLDLVLNLVRTFQNLKQYFTVLLSTKPKDYILESQKGMEDWPAVFQLWLKQDYNITVAGSVYNQNKVMAALKNSPSTKHSSH